MGNKTAEYMREHTPPTPRHDMTRQAKHTPGPWETAVSSNSQNEIYYDVCLPDGGDMIADLKDCENAEANARLIAACPELLAALRSAVFHLESPLAAPLNPSAVLINARAAIAKATGGQP